MAIDPRRIGGLYERGIFTENEAVIQAAQAAVANAPETFVDVLPPGCVADLRRPTHRPRARP